MEYNYNQPEQDEEINKNFEGNTSTEGQNTCKSKKSNAPIIVIIILCCLLAVGIFFGIKLIVGGNNNSSTTTETGAESSDRVYPNVNSVQEADYSGGTLDVSALVEATMPSLVSITNVSVTETQDIYSYFGIGSGQSYESESLGSGVIIGENETELLIVTNAHVIEGASTLTVTTYDEASYEAVVKGSDSDVDIAVIAVKLEKITDSTLESIKIASFGDSDSMKIGQPVVAIGNAAGIGQSVTTGIISAVNRSLSTSSAGLIQTDAAINPGNSGGALFNTNGEVIGINSSKFVSTQLEGMGFAIPSAVVQPLAEKFMSQVAREKVSDENSAWLGISGQSVSVQVDENTSKDGVYITSITDGSAVDKAGIPLQSIILKFDGYSVATIAELKERLAYYSAGETVEITCLVVDGKDYVEKTFQVTLDNANDYKDSTSSSNSGSNNFGGSQGGGYGSGGYSQGGGNFFNFGY